MNAAEYKQYVKLGKAQLNQIEDYQKKICG